MAKKLKDRRQRQALEEIFKKVTFYYISILSRFSSPDSDHLLINYMTNYEHPIVKAFKNSFPIVGVSGSLSELMEMSHHVLSVFDQLPLDTFAEVRNNLNDTFLFNVVLSRWIGTGMGQCPSMSTLASLRCQCLIISLIKDSD